MKTNKYDAKNNTYTITDENEEAFGSNHHIDDLYCQISNLKNCLDKTDYQCSKFQDGDLTEEEYAPIKEIRHKWREKINILEAETVNYQIQNM